MLQRQAQEARDTHVPVHPLQEALRGIGGLIADLVQTQRIDVDQARAHLAVTDLAHSLTDGESLLHHLAQIGLLVAGFDVVGREVANHARDAAERGRGEHVGGEHVHEDVFGIRDPCAVIEIATQTRPLDERAGIKLDLIGLIGSLGDQAPVVALVAFRRCAQQVDHRVRMNLEPEGAQQLEGALDALDADAAIIGIKNLLVKTLNSHLNLSCAQLPDERERVWRHGIRTSLDHQANHTMARGLVGVLKLDEFFQRGGLHLRGADPCIAFAIKTSERAIVVELARIDSALLFRRERSELFGGLREAALAIKRSTGSHVRRNAGVSLRVRVRARRRIESRRVIREHGVGGHVRYRAIVQRAEQLGHKPDLVLTRIIAPRAAQNDELDLVDGVPHLRQRRQARGHLQVGVEPRLLGALARGLAVQIALGHADIIGAVAAIAGTRPGLGDDRNGRHARRRAPRLHAQHRQQLLLQLRRHSPGRPALGLVALDVLVERQQTTLGVSTLVRGVASRLGVDDFHQRAIVDLATDGKLTQYVQNDVFHGRNCIVKNGASSCSPTCRLAYDYVCNTGEDRPAPLALTKQKAPLHGQRHRPKPYRPQHAFLCGTRRFLLGHPQRAMGRLAARGGHRARALWRHARRAPSLRPGLRQPAIRALLGRAASAHLATCHRDRQLPRARREHERVCTRRLPQRRHPYRPSRRGRIWWR